MHQDFSNLELRDRVELLLLEVIDRRHAGEPLPDEELIASHPELKPLLAERLGELREIESICDAPVTGEKADLPANFLPRVSVPGYRVKSVISVGGQGIVLLAEATESGRKVAIKILRDGRLADSRQRERLAREANLLARLSHPNIVAFVDRGETPDGQFFLVTDYVEGHPLEPAQFAAAHPISQRLDLFLTICYAVDAAHKLGIVHRDIKPSNIRLDRAGVPHVLDFGLARSPADGGASLSMTAPGHFLGSFLWASPEQLEGDAEITPASDVYSLGVLLHQLLADGAFPPSVVAYMVRRLGPNAPAERAQRLRHELTLVNDPALSAILSRCLAAKPLDRFSSAGELARSVADYLVTPQRRRKRISRRLVLVVSFLFIATLVIALVLWSRLGTPAPQGTRVVNGRPIERFLTYYDLVWIPPGEAMLGSSPNAILAMPDEGLHRVKFEQGFYILRSEVCRELWSQVMPNDNPHDLRTNRPVTNVSWFDAQEFCRRLSAREGHTYRLPTEDEWEYAARAGVPTDYPPYITITGAGGEAGDWPMLPRYANYADRSSGLAHRDSRYSDGASGVSDCFKYVGNAWDLCDTIGNVWEWTNDAYRPDLSVPSTGRATTQPAFVSTRGGSWYDTPHTLRYGNRNPLPAAHKGENVGFRIVREDSR